MNETIDNPQVTEKIAWLGGYGMERIISITKALRKGNFNFNSKVTLKNIPFE